MRTARLLSLSAAGVVAAFMIIAWWLLWDRDRESRLLAPGGVSSSGSLQLPAGAAPAGAASRESHGPSSELELEVCSSIGGAPIGGIPLQLIDPSEPTRPPLDVRTDASGIVLISPIGERPLRIRAAAERFLPVEKTIGELRWVSPRRARLDLQPTGILRVWVRGALDTPVPGAFVLPSDEPVNVHHPKEWPAFIPSSAVCYWKGTYQIPETDDRGFVELRGLPCAVKMWLSLTGDFIPKKVECSIDPDKTFTELRIEVDAGAKVRGRVIDEGGVPLPREGVTLTLRPQPSFGANALRSAITDGEGRYEFLGLPREEVRVGVPELGSNSIVVKIEQDVVQLEDLVVPRGGEFSGRIVSSYPLADGKRFKVLLYSGGALASSAECEPSGRFKGTAPARQGRVVVWFTDRDHSNGVTVYSAPVVLPARNMEIRIDGSMGILAIEASGATSKRDVGSQGSAGASSSLRKALLAPKPAQASSDAARSPASLDLQLSADGASAIFGGIPPGFFTLTVPSEQGGWFVENVEIRAGEITSVPISTSPQFGTIEGVSCSSQGTPVRASVQARSATGVERVSVAGEDGRFEFSKLPPGLWTLSAKEIVQPSLEPRHSGEALVEVRAEMSSRVDLTLTSLAVVRGRVVSIAGEPIGGVNILCQKNQKGPILDRISDSHGNFEYRDLSAGNYWIAANSTGIDPADVELAAGEEKSIELRQVPLELRVRLKRDGHIVSDLTTVSIRESQRGARRSGRVAADGWLEIPRPRQLSSLIVGGKFSMGPPQSQRLFIAILEQPMKNNTAELDTPSGSLTVILRKESELLVRPRAEVLTVHGIPLQARWRIDEVEDLEGKRVFRGVPHRSTVELMGIDMEGKTQTRAVSFEGADLEVQWP
ncbi:MAG: carboxypeptidase regulatory-like domain-containing protein [Planctomycetes bacterium]|nr:carboxypeptidase regulatory-like domain-containing protein [Planctomycetota bacterium]